MLFHQEIQTLIRLQDGSIWNLYHTKKDGIVFRSMGKDRTWSSESSIASDSLKDFSLDVDDKNRIHLVHQNKKGELKYLRYNGQSWSSQILTTYEPLRYIIRYPTVLVFGQKIHVIIALGAAFNVGLWTLLDYYWDGHSWSQFEICRFAGGKQISPFQLDVEDGDLHLCYRALEDQHYQIYYIHFSSAFSRWSSREKISAVHQDCSFPGILADKRGSIHFVWSTLSASNIHIHYAQRSSRPEKNGVSREVKLSVGHSNCTHPALAVVGRDLWAFWIQNDQVMGTRSENGGNIWSNPEPLPLDSSGHLYIYRYVTNVPEDMENSKARYLYANMDTWNTPFFQVSSLFEAQPDSQAEIETKEETKPEIEATAETAAEPEVEAKADAEEFPITDEEEKEERDLQILEIVGTPRREEKDVVERINELKEKIEEMISRFEKESGENRLGSFEQSFRHFEKQLDHAMSQIKKSEADILELSASLQNLIREYHSVQGRLSPVKERSLIQKILSSIRGT